MKKVFGSLLCLAAIGLIFSHIIGQKSDTPAHNAQDWALIGVLLAVGVPLSGGKKKSES